MTPTVTPTVPPDPQPDRADEVALWRETHERVCALVEGLEPSALEVRVPACPDWTARDLLSHVVGLGADVVAGDEPDDHHERWTRAQVVARTGRSAAELLAEWRGLVPDLERWMGEHGTRPLSDVVIHEQDLRSALGRPGGRDARGFAVVRERMVGRLGQRLAALPSPAPLLLLGDDWRWSSDAGADRADGVVVSASGFDLGRALMSRRTADQLRGWTTAGDLSPLLPAFEVLGPLPDRPLPE